MGVNEIIEQIKRLPQQEQLKVLESLRRELGAGAQPGDVYRVEEESVGPLSSTTPVAVAAGLAEEAFERHASLFRRLAR